MLTKTYSYESPHTKAILIETETAFAASVVNEEEKTDVTINRQSGAGDYDGKGNGGFEITEWDNN